MKIRVAFIDNDENYVKRLVSNLQINYADKIEPYFFTTYDMFLKFYRNNRVQVVLVSEDIEVEKTLIPQEASFAWLVSNNAVREWEGYPAVGKYQKAELLYKSVLSLYADLEGKFVFQNGKGGKNILFTSPQGGVGNSAVAIAYAVHMGRLGRKVIYLNLGCFEQAENFFQGEGSATFYDVIYALKSKNGKLPIKLESIMRHDSRGVYFFCSSKNPNDMLELNLDDISLLFETLSAMEGYDGIIVDMPMDFSPAFNLVMEKYANEVVMLCDGSRIGNDKIRRALEIMKIKFARSKEKGDVLAKCKLLYNRVSAADSQKMTDIQIDAIGEINRYDGVAWEQLIEKIGNHPCMAQLEI